MKMQKKTIILQKNEFVSALIFSMRLLLNLRGLDRLAMSRVFAFTGVSTVIRHVIWFPVEIFIFTLSSTRALCNPF